MKAQTDTMREYIAASTQCDWDHPWLRKRAQELIEGASSPEEKALRIFYHVRDAVRFSLAYSRSKASHILKQGYGDCGSKTNVQVALLRAVGIPARFRWVKARSEVLHHLIAGFVYKNMPPVASHFWAECHLHGEWVSCELLLDQALYQGMLEAGLITREQIPTIDWDGKTDLVLLRPWITEDCGHLSSLEEALQALQHTDEGMPPAWLEWLIAPVFYPLNRRYSDRIRRQASE